MVAIARDPKFPIPDLSEFPIRLAISDDGVIDLAYSEGLLSDGRPFYARLWSDKGSSFLSTFFSARDLPSISEDSVRQLLEREALLAFGDSPPDTFAMTTMTDSAGNDLINATVSVGGADPNELLDYLNALGSLKLFGSLQAGRTLQVNFPVYPLRGATQLN